MKNREIKFRAFIDGEMINADALAFEEYLPVSQLLSNCENIMQFTGLYDKNGKKIYEGDIMSLLDGTIIATITYNDGSYHFSFDEFEVNPIRQDRAKKWQVIGNIYQHPYLLK